MEMKAIADNYGIAEAAIMTIEAGADCVLISHTPKWQQEAYEALVGAVKSGRLSEKRIDKSVERIFRTKARFGLLEAKNIALPDIADIVNSSIHQELMAETAGQGITVVRQTGALPIPSSEVMVVEAVPQAANLAESVLGEAGTLSEALQKCGVEVISETYHMPLTEQAISEMASKARGQQVIVVVTQDGHRDPGQQRLVRALAQTGVKIVVVGARTPYELEYYPAEVGYIAAYGSMAIIWQGVAEVLTGRRRSTGKLPVSIPGVAGVGYAD